MAWTTPRIWDDGIIISAAQMNAVSDNLRETAPAKAEAYGDIFYATGANQIERLPFSQGRRQLTNDGTRPAWSNVPSPLRNFGEMIVGDSNGNPTVLPLPRSSDGEEQFVLVARGRNRAPVWEPADNHF